MRLSHRPTTRRLVLGLLAAALLVVATAAPAGAHRNDESYIYLDVGDDSLSGRVELPYPDLRSVFDFSLTGSEDDLRAEIESRLDFLQTYAAERSSVGGDGVAWPMTFDGYELLEEGGSDENGTGYVQLPFVVELPGDSVPQLIDVTFTPFLEEIENRNNIALISNDWQRGVIDEEANELLILDLSRPGGTIDLDDPSQWRNFTASIDLGVDHIRTGPDHIFFILVLLLTSVLILRNDAWKPSPTFLYSFGRVLIVATMFTVAHSITFTLAGLDLIPLPSSKLVESLIALSIGAAALHNLRPVLGHREWSLAFVFGLFHGMGFAGLIEDLDISDTTKLVSLLGRNVGIEIGQIVIILITFPLLFLLRRTRFYRPFFIVSSLVLAAVSFVWVIERVFELDAGINGGIERAVEWPRILVVAVLATAATAGLYHWEKRNGRLLPLGDADDAAAPDDQEPEPAPV